MSNPVNTPVPMNTVQDDPKPKAVVGPFLALILSGLVMPGLGQILVGHLYRGLLMMGCMALWLPWALINLGRDVTKIMEQLASETPGVVPNLSQVQEALGPLAETSLSFIFLPLVVIWFWALADSIGYLISTRKNKL